MNYAKSRTSSFTTVFAVNSVRNLLSDLQMIESRLILGTKRNKDISDKIVFCLVMYI